MRQGDEKKSRSSGNIHTKSSSGKATTEDLSSNDTGSSVPWKKKKRDL